MRKIKVFLCLAIIVSLISPGMTFISKAQANTTKEIKEVNINWNENEEEMVGSFDVSTVYESDYDIYLGGRDISCETLDFILNNEKFSTIKFENIEEYKMMHLNDVNKSEANEIIISKDLYNTYQLNNMKVLLVREIKEDNSINKENNDERNNETTEEETDGLLNGEEDTSESTTTLNEVKLGENEYLEVIEAEINTNWNYSFSSKSYKAKFIIPSKYISTSKIYLGGSNISEGEKAGLIVNGVDMSTIKFSNAGSDLDQGKESYKIIPIDNAVSSLGNGSTFEVSVSRKNSGNPVAGAKVYITNIRNKKSNYIPQIDTSNAKETIKDNDTYALDLYWKKTKTQKSGSYEKATVEETFIADSSSRYVLPDNITGVIQPLQTQDIIKGSNGVYKNYYLDYRSLLSYIEPTQVVTWQTDSKGIKLDGWNHTTSLGDKTSWRMYRGVFKLADEQINDIKNGDAQLFLGIDGGNNPATILGINDYLSVLVNGQQTNINVSTSTNGKMNLITYESDDAGAAQNYQSKTLLKEKNENYTDPKGDYYCDESSHDIGTSPTKTIDGWHLHLNDLGTTDSIGNTALLGDISSLVVNKSTTSSKVHRLEMLTGEFANTGGVSKLEVYYVKKPKIDATKSAFIVEDNKEVDISNNQALTPGEKVYFKLGIENKGKTQISENIYFADYNADLGIGVYVDNTGVYKTDSTLKKGSLFYTSAANNGLDNIIVKKYEKNNDGKWQEIDQAKTNKEKLSSLNKNQKIEIQSDRSKNVKDPLMYLVKDEDVGKKITNSVKVGCKYMGQELDATANADITMNIVDAKVNAIKSIVKVNNGEPQKDNNLVITSPGDIVTFKITLNNMKDKKAQGLDLEDVMKLDDNLINNITWKFYSDENCTKEVTNLSNFEIQANEELVLYTKYTIPPDQNHNSQYKNIINLYQKKVGEQDRTLINTSEVDFKVVSTGSLKFMKEVDNNNVEADNQEFTVNIKGSDNTEYNIRLTRGKEVELKGLKYGVTYTITELVIPMNYEYTGIKFETQGEGISVENKKLNVTLSNNTNKKIVTISNKKINNEGLLDKGYIKNTFKYLKNIVSREVN